MYLWFSGILPEINPRFMDRFREDSRNTESRFRSRGFSPVNTLKITGLKALLLTVL
jgi:hypothetical protein